MQKRSKFSKKIIASSLALLFGLTVLGGFALSPSVYAAEPEADPAAETHVCPKGTTGTPTNPCVTGDEINSTPDPAAKACTGNDCSGLIEKYVNPFIKLLSALAGVAVAGAIAYGGVKYSAAGGDPSKVVAAKKHIYDAILALLAYLFMFAFLQWLLPGGIV